MIYARLYIDPTTRKVALCETDQQPINREILSVYNMDEEGKPTTAHQLKVVVLEIEDLRGQLKQIDAREFVEDLNDDGQARFGGSILRINDDFTVSLCSEGAKRNLGNIKDVKYLRINKCEVLE